MTDLRKAAEMALESWDFFFSQAHPEVVGLMYGSDWAKIAKERTEALRQALAQPDNFVYNEDKSYRFSPSTGSFGIGDTPSKQETEWIEDGFGTMWQKCGKKDCGKFVVKIGKVDCWNGDCPETNAPPKREWVGLTDEEIHEIVGKKWWDWEDAFDIEGFSRAIEAKLKEKNSG